MEHDKGTTQDKATEPKSNPDEPSSDGEHREPSPRENHISEALDTVEAARIARDRIAQIEDNQYRDDFAERWKTTIAAEIDAAEEERRKEQEYIDGPGRSRHDGLLLESKINVTRLTGKINYLKSRVGNADAEIATELERSKGVERAIIENLAWALGELYDLDETKCAGLSAERLGQVLTEESGWAADAQRCALKEKEIMRRAREAEVVLANPEFPYLGLNELKDILRNIAYDDTYKDTKTREDWQTVLNDAVQIGIENARRVMRLNVEGDKRYVLEDL